MVLLCPGTLENRLNVTPGLNFAHGPNLYLYTNMSPLKILWQISLPRAVLGV